MNPSNDTPSAIDLPQPSTAQSPVVQAPAAATMPSGVDDNPVSSPQWLPPTVPVHAQTPNPETTQNPAEQSGQGMAPPSLPNDAADSDIIEKEWVMRAREIIESNRQDPFAQAEALQKLKAGYLAKRYNKTIGAAD